MKKNLLFKKIFFVILLAGFSSAGWAQVVISQVYGGGGNSGSTYKNDFIELFNRGTTPVTINGWSVQYTSATGASWTNMTTIPLTPTIIIAPGQYYLIQEAAGTAGTVDLPTPDLIGTIGLSGTAGKVALVNTATAITVSCPTGTSIVDFVGFGLTANCYEGSGATPAPSNTNSVSRASNGCTDDNNNASDFSAGAANPRNSASPLNICSIADVTPPSFKVTPHNNDINVAVDVPIVLTFDEAIRNIDDSEITDANVGNLLTLTETNASGAVVDFNATIDADKKIITVTPSANLANGQVYYAAIAPVEDAANNATEQSSMTFTTIAFVAPDLVITEIMYNSPGDDEEWIEIYNNGTSSVDMSGYYILDSDIAHVANPMIIPSGSIIAPGAYFTIETSTFGFFPFIPNCNVLGSTTAGKFNFGNTSDQVKLYHSNGQLIDSVLYTDTAPWPTAADGGGSSLTFCDPNLDNSLASSWEASLDEFTTLQGSTIYATPGSGCVLHTAVTPKLQSGITVYPNPVSDNLYISNPLDQVLEIAILSSIGKQIKSLQVNQGITSVDLSDMPKGIYLVKMLNKTSKTIQTNKVVVR